MSARRRTRGVSVAELGKLALALPGVEEGTSYGTLAYRVRKKLLARLREDSETLALRVELAERDLLCDADPKAFFVTDHYRNYPIVVVRLAAVRSSDLAELLEQAWRDAAPKKVVATYDAET